MYSPLKFCSRLILTLAFMVLAFMVLAFTITPQAWAKTLKIGTISAVPVDEIRTFQPFADYLAAELADDGIEAAEVLIAADVHQMAAMLKSGEADLFIDSSVTALVVNKLSGSKYMLRRWKKGRGQYRSVIFVRDDSTITSLADLKGKTIAFEEPFSTSGYMLPALSLGLRGLEFFALDSTYILPPADKVGYIMAFDNETQAAWVERNRVQAAAMAEDDFKDLSKTSLEPLRALLITPYVPYHVVTHRLGLDAQLVERIKTVLKAAHETERGSTVLSAFERTAKFDDIPPSLLDNVFKLAPLLGLLPSLN